MINITIPNNIDGNVFRMIVEILRRSVDGTVVPIFVDYTNQRVFVGASSASSVPQKLEVTGNVKILGSGNGIIIPNANGSYYKCFPDTDGAWVVNSVPG